MVFYCVALKSLAVKVYTTVLSSMIPAKKKLPVPKNTLPVLTIPAKNTLPLSMIPAKNA